ncbi:MULTISPECIES: hydantoinase/oxoprolinase family protein [unclassified Burkholderia]|uniref:hydantoinase/oxoprolinase family protein n=1 Tax=unclassified Burkholderia TaxID=2613784 RepID=UPI001627A3A4|nr:MULTISPECIES: hydantoinase/oxoprolinase family protein [unclassified Burkholderia]
MVSKAKSGTAGSVKVGIDVGGTFTDVVCVDEKGELRLMKVPTSRRDPSIAIRQAMSRMENEWGISAKSISRFVHGTTAGTNAVLERKGARIGLVTTEGFKDVLEIGRQMRHRMYDMILAPETPVFLAPGARRKGVPERIAADGSIVTPLDEAALNRAVDELVEEGVEAIAVCFLFSFLNAAHEVRARALIQSRHPDLMVSLSCEVDPSFREYERTAATAFDAYVKPVLDQYLANLESDLRRAEIPAPLQIMQSRGGICSAQTARQRPVRLFLSGPAAGVIGARYVGQEVAHDNLITVDIGGTSCDISVINAGKPVVRSEGLIDGYPVRVPMVDVNAIGSGGGSIAWLDASNLLRVGPESAGSEPGPACYGRGGTKPTVTDASVVLGYIDPNNFAGGTLVLNPELAYESIRLHVAQPMGLSVAEAALGIHRVLNAQMVEGIRLASIRRGFDPRDFSLMPLGGGGALHATALAGELGMQTIVVPRNPGVLCAFGLLSAPVEHEMATAFPCALRDADSAAVDRVLAGLDDKLATLMHQEGVGAEETDVSHSADVCYVGQSYSLEVPFEPGLSGDERFEQLYESFLKIHDRVYGHSTRGPARIVNLRSVHQASCANGARLAADVEVGPAPQRRPMFFNATGPDQPVESWIYQRSALSRDVVIEGPAVIEQMDTTILVEPGWTARVGAQGNLILSANKGNDNERK